MFGRMETPDTSDKTVDPKMLALSIELETLRKRVGMSKRKLASLSGVHPTQLGQFLLGRVGLSYEKACDVSRALGAALVVEVGTETHPVRIGTIDELGRFMADHPILTLPGIVEISAPLGRFQAGDQILVRASDSFEEARWVLIERGSGRSLMQCETRGQGRFLVGVDGDAVLYEPARHRIIARIYGRVEAM